MATTRPSDAFLGPHWSPELIAELKQANNNGQVGTTLVSEDTRVRVWLIAMQPGERLPFHTHVLDYFWVATTPGKARSLYSNGHVAEVDYVVGDTKHFSFSRGESMTHDLENIGETTLCFTTVEFLNSANSPLD